MHPWSIETDYHTTSAYLPHYTAGQTYFYPAFNASRTEDAIKFAHEFGEVIAEPIMLEAVMRVRASKSKFQPTICYYVELMTRIRPQDVVFPWQLLRSINRSSGHACCSSGSLVCYRSPN